MTPRDLVIAVILVLNFALSGCGFVTFVRVSVNNALRPGDVAFITPGETTFATVVERLGPPNELRELHDGVVATYFFLDAKYTRLNPGWAAGFLLPPGVPSPDVVMAGGGLGTDMFQVLFDRDWKATAAAFAYHTGTPSFSPWPFSRGTPSPAPPKEEERDNPSDEAGSQS